mgnify:FL=1
MDGALVATPYEAKEDIKAFKNDVEWHPATRGKLAHRRWNKAGGTWAINYADRDEFIDHMAERDWIVIDLHEIHDV